jgi:murein DD-endopeptidase MepM/ murein hydrolase activator NlpD
VGKLKKMIKKNSKSIIFFILISCFNLSAAENNSIINDLKDKKINVFEMKRKIEDQSRQILELTKEMSQVENNLGIQNKKYLKMAENRAKLEEALNVTKKNIDLDNLNLKKNLNETKNILMGILLNQLEKTESPSDLLAKKILVTNLRTRMIDLENLMKSNGEVQNDVGSLNKRLEQSIQTEKELVGLMNDLELRKKDLKETIIHETNKKAEIVQKFDDEKNKLAMEKDSLRRKIKKEELSAVQSTEEIKIPSREETVTPLIGAGYKAPLYLHQGIEYNQKGVTFKFLGKNEVLAPRAGKIVYTGSLANYGNVVMIDHGNDSRSVVLGQFDFSVKNGETVRELQIIGYTNPKNNNGIGDGKIYFEVRKNNLAQNTYLLLDKKTLAKNTSK